MAEKEIRIQGPDGNGIYGVHCSGGNSRLVIHIHGLTHQPGYLLEVTSSEFFEENGYDHYRVGLYATPADSRKLNRSTLSTHVKDVRTILDYFQESYKEIFISAHSLAGPVMLMLNPAGVKAISLWDPSTDVTNFWGTGPYLTHLPERQEYLLDYGNIFVLGENMVKEIQGYPNEKCLKLAGEISAPVQFVIPEQSIFLASPHTSPEQYRDAFKGPFDLQYIKGANHRFSNRGNRKELFEATLRFFNQYALG